MALSVGDVDHPPLSRGFRRDAGRRSRLHRFVVLEGWTDTDPAVAIAPATGRATATEGVDAHPGVRPDRGSLRRGTADGCGTAL